MDTEKIIDSIVDVLSSAVIGIAVWQIGEHSIPLALGCLVYLIVKRR